MRLNRARALLAAALVLAAAGLIGVPAHAQPGARIDPAVQSVPTIRAGPPRQPDTIQPGIQPQPSAGGHTAPYARELEQLRRAASPKSGFGSTRAAADAAWTLGLLDLHGGVVPLAPQRAALWFRRATSHNLQPWAWAGVAWCALDGCDAPPDPAAARVAIDKLKRSHPARAQYLEWLLETAHRPITLAQADAAGGNPDELPYAALLRSAGAAGDTPALLELGIAAAAQDNLKQAQRYFERAAPRSPAARANLELLDDRAASPRASPGNSEADRLLAQAQRFHRGDGVPINYVEAIRLYQRAAAKGSAPAQRMLNLIFSRPAPNGSIDPGWMAQLARLDVHSSLPTLERSHFAGLLQRDPTPLFDLIPQPWSRRIIDARQ